MATTVEQLVTLLEARIAGHEREIEEALQRTERFLEEVVRRASRIDLRLRKTMGNA